MKRFTVEQINRIILLRKEEPRKTQQEIALIMSQEMNQNIHDGLISAVLCANGLRTLKREPRKPLKKEVIDFQPAQLKRDVEKLFENGNIFAEVINSNLSKKAKILLIEKLM